MQNNNFINPNPIIIECSAKDALPKPAGKENSEWENITAYPINLNDGDQVILKNVFIDTGGSDIKLDNDLVLSGKIGYYEVNYDWTGKRGFNGYPPHADYKYYIAWDSDTETADLISFRVKYITPENCGFNTVTCQVSFTYDTPDIQDLTWTMNKPAKLTCANAVPHGLLINLADYGGIINLNVGSIRNINERSNLCSVDHGSFVYQNNNTQMALLTNIFNITIPAGSYTRDQMAKYISDELSSTNELNDELLDTTNKFLFRTDDPKWLDQRLRFYPTGVSGTDADHSYYCYMDNDALSAYWMGSSQNALVWDEDANHFTWTFLHTPIANPNDGHVMGIQIHTDAGTNNSFTILHQCGVFFMDLQPQKFWAETLNFNLDDLLVKFDIFPDQVDQAISDDELRAKITKGALTIQSLFPTFDRAIAPPLDIWISTTETQELKGQNIADILDTFYLIEINLGTETFSYNGSINNYIRSIVGSYYQDSNWVAGYSSDSVIYQHTGSSQIISKLKIRILDPNTKEPLTTLGENSFIYVMVVPSNSNTANN